MYRSLKDMILGKKYVLSIFYIPSKKSQEINRIYRGKNYPTNVLAFPYSQTEGEILLTKSVIQKEASVMKKSVREWEIFLVIHGILHLKGYRHGSKMEKAEKAFSRKYAQTYLNRNRPRVRKHSSHRRRIHKGRKIS